MNSPRHKKHLFAFSTKEIELVDGQEHFVKFVSWLNTVTGVCLLDVHLATNQPGESGFVFYFISTSNAVLSELDNISKYISQEFRDQFVKMSKKDISYFKNDEVYAIGMATGIQHMPIYEMRISDEDLKNIVTELKKMFVFKKKTVTVFETLATKKFFLQEAKDTVE